MVMWNVRMYFTRLLLCFFAKHFNHFKALSLHQKITKQCTLHIKCIQSMFNKQNFVKLQLILII